MHLNIPFNELIENFFKSRQCFNLVPLGSSATLPVPIKINDKVYISVLFYTGKKVEDQSRIKIYRPHTKIILDHRIARIVNYVDLFSLRQSQADEWKEPIGGFPHKEIETLTLNEYKKRRNELIADYEKTIKLFNGETHDEKFKNWFKERFYQLCEPPLIPYMKQTGSKFFEWLN